MSGGLDKNRLRSVSPSAITNYKLCARQWYNNYVLGLRGPVPQFLARGTALHFGIEHFLRTGEVLIETEVSDAPGVKWPVLEFVQAAIPHLPKPINDPSWAAFNDKSVGLMIEQSGEMGTWEGGPAFRQYLDLVIALPDSVTLQDHKSLSDARYAKIPDELATNLQLISNAKWVASVSDYKEFTLQHMYLLTKGKRPKCWTVSVTVSREHVETEWQKILATVREMDNWCRLGAPTADPLPPNTDACSMYRGCEHRIRCFGEGNPLISINRIPNKEGEKAQMSILSQMLSRAGAAAGLQSAAPAAGSTPVVGLVVPAQGSPAPSGLLGGLLSKKAEAPAPVVATPPPTPVPTTAGELTGYDPNGIVPPDAPLSTSTPEEVAAANGEAPANEAPAEAPKRTRRTKAQMEAARAAEAFATQKPLEQVVSETNANALVEAGGHEVIICNPVEAPAIRDITNDQKPETESQKIARMLLTPDPAFECPVQAIFVDCLPSKGFPGEHPTDLATLMHSFNGLAAASANVTDYRMIDYKAAGYLATAIKISMKGLPSSIYVDSRLPGAAVFLEVTVPYAKIVIRGAR